MTIASTDLSARKLHFFRHLGEGTASPDLWVCAPPRPTLGSALRFVRSLGEDSASHDPEAAGSASPDSWACASPDPWVYAPHRPTLGSVLRLAWPLGKDSASPNPEAAGSASPDLWGRTPPRPTEAHAAAHHSRSNRMGLSQSSDTREEIGTPRCNPWP